MKKLAMPHTTKLNVLVADDDPIFRSLVGSRLVHLDSLMHEAADGGEAWRITRAQRLDLAIIDFEMPGLDGIALSRCLRSHSQTHHIPIIMCTSRTDRASMLAALEAGVSSFITKPVNWSLFERHISHLTYLSEASKRSAAAFDDLHKCSTQKDEIVACLAPILRRVLKSVSKDAELAPLAAQVEALLSNYEQTAANSYRSAECNESMLPK